MVSLLTDQWRLGGIYKAQLFVSIPKVQHAVYDDLCPPEIPPCTADCQKPRWERDGL